MAKSATQFLVENKFIDYQTVEVCKENKSFDIPISSCASLENGRKALAIGHYSSELPLDITRGLEIWAYVEFCDDDLGMKKQIRDGFPYWLDFRGGYGVGKIEKTHKVCISEFTRTLLVQNLYPLLPSHKRMRLEIVFPQGKILSLRTSNRAFGVVDGLALIGTQAEVQVSASPDQLKDSLRKLRWKCRKPSFNGLLTFVIGENGLDLACNFGLPKESIIKMGNWVGPLLVAAAQEEVKNLLLFGYHGKLVKLAGGIFHTHHHLADGRMEVLTSIAIRENIPLRLVKLITTAGSVENAASILQANDSQMVSTLFNRVASQVEIRSQEYLNRYMNSSMNVGAILFDRSREIRWMGSMGKNQLSFLGLNLKAEA